MPWFIATSQTLRESDNFTSDTPFVTYFSAYASPGSVNTVLCFGKRGHIPSFMAADGPCVCAALRRAARTVTAAYDAALAPSGLRVTQFGVLRTLARLGPLPVSRLAREATLDRSTMGRNLDPLERQGFVVITTGTADGRERVVRLTPSGVGAIAAALPHWRAAQKRVAGLVPHSAITSLVDRLRVLERA